MKNDKFNMLLRTFLLLFIFVCSNQNTNSQKLESSSDSAIKLENKALDLSKIWSGESILHSIKLFNQATELRLESKQFDIAVENLHRSVKLEMNLGNYANTLSALNKISKIKETSKLELDIETLCLYSQTFLKLGKTEESKKKLDRAFELSDDISEPYQLASLYTTAGEFYYNQRNFEESSKYYKMSIQTSDNYAEEKAFRLISSSYVFMAIGKNSQGLENAKNAESIFKTIKHNRGLAISRIAKGHLYNVSDKKQTALESYKAAEKLFPKDTDYINYARLQNGIGLINEDFGEWNLSLHHRQKALSLFKKSNYPQGQLATLPSLIKLSYLTNNPILAKNYYAETLTLSKKLNEDFFLAIAEQQIGDYYFEFDDNQNALNYYSKALKTLKKFNSLLDIALIQNNLGIIYKKQGKLTFARKLLNKSLKESEQSQAKFAESNILQSLAELDVSENKYENAIEKIEKSIHITESLSSDIFNSKLSRTYLSKVFDRYELYIYTLMKMHLKFPQKNFAKLAFKIAEKSRSRTILENLRLTETNFTADANSLSVQNEKELRNSISLKSDELTQMFINKSPSEQINKLETELKINENKLEELIGELKSKSPVYSALQNPNYLDIDKLQLNMLSEHSLVLEFSFGKKESYVWLVGKDSFEVFVLPKREVLETQIDKLLELLVASRVQKESENDVGYLKRVDESDNEFNKEAKILSEQLFGQFAEKLKGKRLIVVPDGKLRYFPISALPFPNEDEPFLFTNEVVYVPSASTLNLLRMTSENRVKAKKDFLVLADPIYTKDDDRFASKMEDSEKQDVEIAENVEKPYWNNFRSMEDLNSLGRLQASREEADSILDIFGSDKSEVVSDFEANRDDFKKTELADYKVLHFATHGYLNEERPELSGIVLSKFDKSGNEQDGFIRLQDIYELKLNADLVVLSACDTGVGKEVKGEGLMSLTNGFLQTGAKTVISSRWKVSDQATLYLMKHFYKNLADENLTPSEALRKAQITMSKHPLYESPFHWAAFTVQGEYQTKLNLSRRFNYSGYLLLLSLVLVLFGVYRGYRNYGNYSMRKG